MEGRATDAQRWPPLPPRPPEPARVRALERAAALLARGEDTRIGHRALLRALRPYTRRQSERDTALVGAVRELADAAGARARALAWRERAASAAALAGTLDPDAVEQSDTLLGPLWLSRADELVRPNLLRTGMHRPDVTALLARIVAPGATVVDVGAGIGWFSVLAARLVGERGMVIAVEPGPDDLPVLRANLWRHGCDNTLVLPVAAYSRTGQVELVRNPAGGSGNWIQPGVEGGALVPCARLDEVLHGRPVDVLKVDAQGGDDHAIRGLEATIAASPAITIVCTWWTAAYGAHGSRPADVLAGYQRMGLRPSLLGPTGEERPIAPHALLGMAGEGPFVTLVMRRA